MEQVTQAVNVVASLDYKLATGNTNYASSGSLDYKLASGQRFNYVAEPTPFDPEALCRLSPRRPRGSAAFR